MPSMLFKGRYHWQLINFLRAVDSLSEFHIWEGFFCTVLVEHAIYFFFFVLRPCPISLARCQYFLEVVYLINIFIIIQFLFLILTHSILKQWLLAEILVAHCLAEQLLVVIRWQSLMRPVNSPLLVYFLDRFLQLSIWYNSAHLMMMLLLVIADSRLLRNV